MATSPSTPSSLPEVFNALRPVLEPYIPEMQVIEDNDHSLYLNTRKVMKNGQPLFFGSLAINKRYVSFYVFPVYMYPDLMESFPDLVKRMQGKSCFNFRTVTPEQVEGMRQLVKAGYDRFKAEGDL
jgi:hypothetical protein